MAGKDLLVRVAGWRLVGLAQTPQGRASVHKEGAMNILKDLFRYLRDEWAIRRIIRKLRKPGKAKRK